MTAVRFSIHVLNRTDVDSTQPRPVLDFEHSVQLADGSGTTDDYLWTVADDGRLIALPPEKVRVCLTSCEVPDCSARKEEEKDAAAVGDDLTYREGYLELQRTLATTDLILNDIQDKLLAVYPGSSGSTRPIGEILAVVLAELHEYKRIADTLLPAAQRWRQYFEVFARPSLKEALDSLPPAHTALWAAVYAAEGQAPPSFTATPEEPHHGPPSGFSTNPAPNPRQG